MLGKEHPSTLASVNNLATVLRAQGDHKAAGELHRWALEGREKVLGKEHPNTLLGTTPEDTLLNIIGMFIYFFRSYGALVVLLGVFMLKSVVEGNRKGATSSSIVMIGFGFCIMNVDSIAAAIIRNWFT